MLKEFAIFSRMNIGKQEKLQTVLLLLLCYLKTVGIKIVHCVFLSMKNLLDV